MDYFDDNTGGACAYDLFQGDFVIGRYEARAGEERLKIAAIFFLAGDGKSAQRASVKGIVQGHDLEFLGIDFVAVGARHLERALHGLGAGVAEERAVEAAGFGETLGERGLVGVVVEIRGVQQAAGLLADHLHQTGVRVAERVHADAGDEVEVALAGWVKHITAFAAVQYERVAGIGLEQVLALERLHASENGLFGSRYRRGR